MELTTLKNLKEKNTMLNLIHFDYSLSVPTGTFIFPFINLLKV